METRSLTHKGTAYVIEVEEAKGEQGAYVCQVRASDGTRVLKPEGSPDVTFVRHARSAKALLTEIEDEILNNSLKAVDVPASPSREGGQRT